MADLEDLSIRKLSSLTEEEAIELITTIRLSRRTPKKKMKTKGKRIAAKKSATLEAAVDKMSSDQLDDLISKLQQRSSK